MGNESFVATPKGKQLLATDTPSMKVPTSGCPEGKDTCTNDPGLDPIHNYMDYSTDPCYEEFTQGQVDRAVGFFTQYRQ